MHFGPTCFVQQYKRADSFIPYLLRLHLRCLDSLLEVLLHVRCRLLGVSLTPIFIIDPDDTESGGEPFLPYIISLNL